MADKNLLSFLVAVLGIFIFIILILVVSAIFGEQTWLKIIITIGIGLILVPILLWLQRLTRGG